MSLFTLYNVQWRSCFWKNDARSCLPALSSSYSSSRMEMSWVHFLALWWEASEQLCLASAFFPQQCVPQYELRQVADLRPLRDPLWCLLGVLCLPSSAGLKCALYLMPESQKQCKVFECWTKKGSACCPKKSVFHSESLFIISGERKLGFRMNFWPYKNSSITGNVVPHL